MNFSIGNLNGTNANISSLISDLIARKSSSMNSLLEQKSSIEASLAALQNSALGTGSINNSYSSQIASLQDTIDTLKEQYTINSNKLSTINSLNNSYKKVVSTLDDYIESLKNPNKNDSNVTWTNSNSNVADVTINSNGASIQRVDLTVTQLATTSIIKSEFLSGGSISLDTKITDLFAGKYDSATNTITSTRTDLNENIKLSELGITNGSFKLGSHTIRVDSSKTLGDLMNEINSLGGYTAKLETTYDANGNAVSSFSITGSNGKSVGITNVANALNIKGNMTSDTKLSQLGIESGVYQVGNQQITVDAKKDTVGSLIEKISSAGYNASIVNDPDNAGSKKLLITDASGDEVVNETASNFASVIGLTVSEGNFTINGESFDINASTTIGSLINDINKATADGVGAKLENNKLVFVASKTGEIDINVGKGTSNFTNAIGFTVGGVMNKDNLVMGSDGSYVTLAGLNQGIKNTDSVKNGKFTTGNFTISYNKIDKNGVALDEMLTTEINITEDDTVESIIQKIKDQTQQTYTDKNGNTVTTSLTAEIVDGKFQIRQTQKGAQYKIAVSAGSSTFTEYVGLTQKVNPGVATSGSATTFTGIKDVTADMTFSEGNFKITASKANDPSQTESVVIDVAQGETLQSVIDKINDSGLAITAQIKDGKLQLMHNNYGADYSISVEAGSSDFTNKVGFTAETSVGVSNNGTNSTLTGLVGGFTLNSASFSEGSFVLQTNALSSDGKTASDDMLSAVIEVKSTDTIQDIINKINSATVNYNGQDVSLGLTASLTADGKIQIQQNNGGEGFDIKVEAGDTNFTQKVGLTTSVSTGVSSSATVSYVIGSSSYVGTFSGGSFKISTNALDESGKGAALDMLSVDVNIQEGSKLNDDLINSINSQINSIGLHASITSDGKIKIEQLNAGADFDIKIEAGDTNFTQKTGLTTDVQNIGTLTPGRDVNQFTSLTGVNNVSEDTAVSQGTFKINGVTINFNDGNIASAIEQINALKDQTGVNAYLKDGKVVLQANVTGPDTTIYVENGTSSFGEVAGFISQSSMGGSATIGQVGSKTTLTGAYDVSDDTTVSGGTIKINGYDIVIDSGSLKDAIDKINSASDKTGVTADIVNNRFVLTNTTNSTNSISVEAGSSDIAQKTGIAAYQSKQGTQEIKNATKSALKASKQNLTGAESITNSSITINGQKIDLSGNVNSAINQINNYSSTTGVKAYLDEDGRFTLENIETGKKAISVSFVSGDFGKVIGAVASSGSSSFIQGGNSNLNNNSQIIGGGSLNIGEKNYSASVSRMTEEEALAKGYTVVKTADQLYQAMLLDEQNIILMNDIDFSAFSTINSFTGTLDGNGYTLSNISGYLIESAENATIKNLAVNSTSGSYNLDSLIYEAANTTLDTVCIVGFYSAIKNAFDEINISDAMIGGQSGGYGFIKTVHAADVTIKNSLNFMSANTGGLLIGSNENGNVTIKNAYGAGTGDIIGSNTGTVIIENVYNLDNSQFDDVHVVEDGIDCLYGIPGFVKDNTTGLPIPEKLAKTFTSMFTEGYTKPGVSVDLSDCNTIGDVIDKINATNSGYVASIENGKFTIRQEGSTEEFTVDYSGRGNFGYVTGLDDYTVGKATGTKRLTEAEAIAQGYTIIKTAQDLQNIKNNLGGKYILMGDIDLSSISAWEAIGATESSAFSGTFDGNGYSIKNLTTGSALYNGLFGVVTGTIKNLNLDNVRIDTVTKPDGTSAVSISAGAVAGWLKGTISNVSVTNSYIYGVIMAGGLVGSSDGNITNSYTENTTVTGNGYLGGLTGSLTGVISHSYSLSQVIAKGGTFLKGAITGFDGGTTKTGSINDVYFDSRISGVTTAVGSSGTLASETLVKDLANLTGSFDSSIWNTSGEHPTLWASSKSLTGATVYGLTENTIFAGLQSGSLSVDVEGTTFNVQLSGTDTLKESLEKIKAEFEKRGFEFNYKIDGGKVIIASDKYFTFDNNNEFIKLSGLSTEGVTYKANFTSGVEYGSNDVTSSHLTEEDAIAQGYTVIKTAQDLQNMKNNLSGKYILMNDIDLSSISNWTAIGSDGDRFNGQLVGNGYTISNLTINGSSTYAGLFGVTGQNAVITDVDLENVNIVNTSTYDESATGALVAINNGTIIDSTVVGSVQGNIVIGGLVGSNSGTIQSSWFSGSSIINSDGYLGGLVGSNQGSITDSYMNGEVKRVTDTGSATNIGGFVGLNTGEIKNSYVKATISNSSSAYSVGGFAAINQGSIADSVWSADSLGSSASGIGNSSTGTSTNLTNVAASDFDAPYYESHVYEKLIKAGNLFINNVEITLSNSNISDAIAQINAQSAKTGIVASIENNKVVLKNADGNTNKISVESGTSNFLEVTGFETEQSGSMEEVLGSDGYIQVTGSVTGLKASDVLGGLTKGTFTITQGANNINIAIESTDSLQDIIDKINATGKYTASIDSKGRFTIVSKEAGSVNLEFGGTSNFAGLAGLSEYTVEDNSITSIGTYDKYSTLTGNAYVNTDMTFSEGNFILSLGDKSVEFHVVEGESITSVMNKINNSDVGISASIQNNRLVLTSKTPGSEEIKLQDGTSNFAELTGFVGSGGSITNSVVKGQLSTYTSAYTAMSAQNQGISAGNFFVHLTDANGNITDTVEINVLKNESINSIMEKINNSGLGITASINDSGKMVITRNSSDTAGGVLVTRGSSDFTNKIGFTSGGHQSVDVNQGSSAQIVSQNSVTGSKKFSEGDFTLRLTGENAKDITISIDSSDTIDTIIHKINSMDIGITASLDANGKVVFERDADTGEGGIEIIKGSSDFTTVLGFTKGGAQSAVTVEGNTAEIISKTAVSASKRFSAGDFTISLTGENAKDITINISETNTITDIINKINEQNAGITAYLDSDRKLVIKRDADMGEGGIEIKKGSSNFTNEMGFTSGGNAIISAQTGSVAIITGTSTVNTAESSGYSAGNFYIQMYNKDGSKGDLIQIDVGTSGINGAVDSVATIVNTINSKNAGITASIVNGKLVLTRDQDQAAGSFEIIKGSSDFTNKIGLTSGGNYIGDTTQGDAATQTVLTSEGLGDLLVRDSMTLGSIGVKNGTFRINGVDILVKASDTIYDLAARINSVFSDPKYADSRIIASYENGELTLRTKQASSTARIEVEAGSTNFTEIAKLTENYRNSVDLGKTELGQNAHFNINGKDYDMALDLNDITDDGIYNGNNLIYLDKDGNVVTDPNDAAITIELKKTGQTTIDIGNNLLNDSVSKLQNFVNKFNSAMNASENPILSDDSEFAAFINKIKSALTSNVGAYNKITQQLADIGIIVKVTGGTNSNMGSVHMSLSKTDGKYDYVEAFYQNPQKVFDIILGDYSQPLDNTVAGVFTRLSDVLHTNLESNRNGYFKVTPRLLESQQKAIKKEITSTTFDLNELKNIAMGTDSTEGLSEYLKQLEQQYQLINEAILALNKQYSNSLTKLILNQNNSSFNPIV